MGSALTRGEQIALLRARLQGWLEITPSIGDGALQCWQRECQRKRKAFALCRPEPHRTSIWIILPDGWSWTQAQHQLVMHGCIQGSVLLGPDSLRAFVVPGSERRFFARLLTRTEGDPRTTLYEPAIRRRCANDRSR